MAIRGIETELKGIVETIDISKKNNVIMKVTVVDLNTLSDAELMNVHDVTVTICIRESTSKYRALALIPGCFVHVAFNKRLVRNESGVMLADIAYLRHIDEEVFVQPDIIDEPLPHVSHRG